MNRRYNWLGFRLLAFIGCVSMWILFQLDLDRLNIAFFVPDIKDDLLDGTTYYPGFVVDTVGCRIPDMDPMDVAVQKFLGKNNPIKCDEEYGPALVESNLTAIYLNKSALPHYKVKDFKNFSCCYSPFWRREAEMRPGGVYKSNVDTLLGHASECTPFNNSATIHDEFVRVECFVGNDRIYKDYHAFIPEKPATRNTSQARTDLKNKVKVLIFGIDAMSRLNLHRQMPDTIKFLKENLNVVEMLGYNKVEDNTFPNLIPVVAGLTVDELTDVCWHSSNQVFDNCNFIWNKFSRLGYTTMFAEDASWMGLFNYLTNGFRKQPTDYYMRIFNHVSENDIGFEKRANAHLCVGPRKTVDTLINYASKFLITTKDILTMAYVWGTSLSHDYLNLPKYGDKDHKMFFETMQNNGIFDNTILLFLSDHGIRCGDILNTYQGHLEARLPFLFVAYPEWFRTNYTTAVVNLMRNAHRLTTHFDLHETLLDLTDLTRLERDALRKRTEALHRTESFPRGISLFLPIPGSRTCRDAGIADKWCTCNEAVKIPVDNSVVNRASQYFIDHVNYLLSDYPQCAELNVSRIVQAKEEKSVCHRTKKITDSGFVDLSIVIETTPGKGLLEVTVRHDGNRNDFTIVGAVRGSNRNPGIQECIPNHKLRTFCYCR